MQTHSPKLYTSPIHHCPKCGAPMRIRAIDVVRDRQFNRFACATCGAEEMLANKIPKRIGRAAPS
jgi:DNA-directed RNA polymerase subunit M/transcription elongation factor TFIIS